MKKLFFIFLIFPFLAQSATLNINTTNGVVTPTNWLKSTFLSGSNMVVETTNWIQGTTLVWAVRFHMPATFTGSGDAGGTNSRQWGTFNLTNWSLIATTAITVKLDSNAWWNAWGSLGSNSLTSKLDSNTWHSLWGGLGSNSITFKLDTNVWQASWGALPTNSLTGKLQSNSVLGNIANGAALTNLNGAQPTNVNLTKWAGWDTNIAANPNLLLSGAQQGKIPQVGSGDVVWEWKDLPSTNTGVVTNWTVTRQPADPDLTNWSAITTASKQESNGFLTTISGLASKTFTNVLIGGSNINVRNAGGSNFLDTTGNLNNWAGITTASKQESNSILQNISGTGVLTNQIFITNWGVSGTASNYMFDFSAAGTNQHPNYVVPSLTNAQMVFFFTNAPANTVGRMSISVVNATVTTNRTLAFVLGVRGLGGSWVNPFIVTNGSILEIGVKSLGLCNANQSNILVGLAHSR